MKVWPFALATLGTLVGAASAQSSVTLYGTIDMAGTYVKNDGSSRRLSLATNGINGSQLGFRGVEDLGSGLKAGFTLVADLVNIDTGSVGPKFFGRTATVSLFSSAGELRLGRDYMPTFWNETIFDISGANGVGNSLNPRQMYSGTRQDNTVGYVLPANLGGVYGQVMVGAAEGGTSGDRPARYTGGRIGFAAGALDIAAAYAQERFAVGSNISGTTGLPQLVPITAGSTQKTWNVGGAYDFGFAKLMGYYDHEAIPNASEKFFSVGAKFPFGLSEVRFGYDRSKLDRSGALPVGALATSRVDQIKATYQYNLSKRTAMYGTVSRLDNKDATRLAAIGGTSSSNVAPTPGGKSSGFQVGVRHFF